jgi:hypothetical protein
MMYTKPNVSPDALKMTMNQTPGSGSHLKFRFNDTSTIIEPLRTTTTNTVLIVNRNIYLP